MDENDLNQLLQVRLCRFCVQPSTPSMPFIAACTCQGPNASLHGACLEEYLADSKATACDVCCTVYKTTHTSRPLLEWLESKAAWEASGSQLSQLLSLGHRLLNNIWFLVFSSALVAYSGGSSLEPHTDSYTPGWTLLQTILGRLIIALGLLRIAACSYALSLTWRAVQADFLTWQTAHPRVSVQPVDGFTPIANQVTRSTARAAGLKPRNVFNHGATRTRTMTETYCDDSIMEKIKEKKAQEKTDSQSDGAQAKKEQ